MQGVAQAMADGIVTRAEEERLRAFRDRLALENSAKAPPRASASGWPGACTTGPAPSGAGP